MSIYQFTAELSGYQPRMWRRFLVNDDITVAELGYVVLCIFRAECSHLMEIEKPLKPAHNVITYEIPNPYDDEFDFEFDDELDDELDDEFDDKLNNEELSYIRAMVDEALGEFKSAIPFPKTLDATKELMKNAVSTEKGDNVLVVNYDFGDDWRFKLKLEDILKKTDEKQIPCVIKGKGYGIIDDCGGAYGLMQIARAAELKSGDDYEQYCDWIDLDEVDLSYFDKDELNEMLDSDLEFIKKAYENPDI